MAMLRKLDDQDRLKVGRDVQEVVILNEVTKCKQDFLKNRAN
ncbi:hypothetical protein DB29_03299 [Shouchella clausii]|nr:hypothetical protein DB29_03299 [Shouchella clausii]